MCISRKGNPPLRLANRVQGARFFVSPFPLVVLPKAKLMIDDLKGVPSLNGRANSGWRRENPPKEENFIGHQTGFTAMFLPGFQTKFNLSKSEYDLVFNGGGESLRCVKTSPIKRLRLNKV